MDKKILIATFSLWEDRRTPINGMVEPMLSFFLPKTDELDLIDGFHPGSNNVITRIESYKEKKLLSVKTSLVSMLLYPMLKLQNKNATQIFFKIRDFLAVFEWAIRAKKKYDLFIGLESVYTAAGIFLKKLGIVKQVVYYVSDYSPNRYKNKWFNSIYLGLDRFCAKNADFIWDVSSAMQKARIKAGLNKEKSSPVILVPNALFPKQMDPLPLSKTIPFSIVYAGTLTPGNGADIAVQAMPEILDKFPKATLHIFGSNGADQARIKHLIKKNNLEKQVIFHGFIKDTTDITRAINKYQIGVAPYLNITGSHRKYGDATKLRLYTGAGLPIITTDVPPLGRQLQKFGAALITKDDPKALAETTIELFLNKKEYLNMRQKAIEFAKNNTWRNVYDNALRQMR